MSRAKEKTSVPTPKSKKSTTKKPTGLFSKPFKKPIINKVGKHFLVDRGLVLWIPATPTKQTEKILQKIFKDQ